VATTKRPLTAKEDLAEARRRAKTARTPIAKVVTKQVVEAKERAYSGRAARETAAKTKRGAQPPAAGTPKNSAARAAAQPRATRAASRSAGGTRQKTRTGRGKA
jgi:hypothetical protein